MYTALGFDKNHDKSHTLSKLAPWEQDDPNLPTLDGIRQIWGSCETPNVLVSLDHVAICGRRDGDVVLADDNDRDESHPDFATPLHPMSWKISKGEKWLVKGENGAGKSTLSRFLLTSTGVAETDLDVSDCTHDLTFGVYSKHSDTRIGWVSTESHLTQVGGTNDTTAWDMMSRDGSIPDSVIETMIQWVFGNNVTDAATLKNITFHELSQGQQKLVLIFSALVLRPNLLILDEVTQGLDWVNRR